MPITMPASIPTSKTKTLTHIINDPIIIFSIIRFCWGAQRIRVNSWETFPCHSHLLTKAVPNYPEEPPRFLFGIAACCAFTLQPTNFNLAISLSDVGLLGLIDLAKMPIREFGNMIVAHTLGPSCVSLLSR